jgi:hypothetical protein
VENRTRLTVGPRVLLAIAALVIAPSVALAQAQPPSGPPSAPAVPPPPPADGEPPAQQVPTTPLPPPRWDDSLAAPSAPRPPTVDLRRAREACETRRLDCDWLALLGALERQAVERAMLAYRVEIDPAPWGKRVGRVLAVNHDVFGPPDGFLQWFNIFHITTRADAVRREVLLRPGQTWDQDKVDETARKLRDPLFSSLAVVVPVRSAQAGAVDLLVVTRDIWSLRFNSNYELQSSKLTYLTLSLSENNLLGRRKLLAAVFEMDQGAFSLGPLYIDKNVAGQRLDLRVRGGALFNRESREYEGSASSVTFARPLWSLDSRWGAGVEWSHRYAIDRAFRRTDLRTYDAPETAEDDLVPWQFRQRSASIDTHVVRGFGDTVEQRVKLGHDLDSQRPEVYGLPAVSDQVRDAFVRDVLPRSERTSVLYVGYEMFTPRFRAVRNVETFDLAEDQRYGPDLDTQAGIGLQTLGSDATFGRFSATGGWTLPLGEDGLVRAAAQVSLRLQEGELIDNSASGLLRVVTPSFTSGRVLLEVRAATLWNDTQNRFVTVGGDNGLRGFPINEFEGQRRFVTQVEYRSRALRLLLARLGGVAFYDLGGAAESFGSMRLHHNVGVGVRALIPQMSPEPFRFDLSFALDGPDAGFPGRIIAGYRQAF